VEARIPEVKGDMEIENFGTAVRGVEERTRILRLALALA
jgi:hypothetical protein